MKIRETLRRLFRPSESLPMPDRIDYSYRVFWMKQARGWNTDRRHAVTAAARTLTEVDGFEANAFERRYRLDGVEGEHSGASLLALIQVMEALDADE